MLRLANQGLPASVTDSGENELNCSVVTYHWSKETGVLSSPVHVVSLQGMCPTVITPPVGAAPLARPNTPAAPKGGFDPICEQATGLSIIPPGDDGVGRVETLFDLPCYMVGPSGPESGGPKKAIVLIYDIFGFAPPNTRHNCDTLAEAGFFVIMPDLFRGSGRRDPAFERPTEEAVDTDLYEKVMPFLKAKGYSVVGLVGFCFGGGVAMRAATTGLFQACAGVHASGLNSPQGEELVGKALSPIMLLQAGGDPPLGPVFDTVQKMVSLRDQCVLRTYWDQNHGWCGATGDRSGNPRLAAAVQSALGVMISFFRQRLVPAPQYTLHLYDHCPFCVKVELAMGWCGYDYERRVWGYGEGGVPLGSFDGSSVVGPAGMMNVEETAGQKSLPILQIHAKQKYAPARGASPYMRESGDIVDYFNKLSGFQLSVNTRTCLVGLAQRTIGS